MPGSANRSSVCKYKRLTGARHVDHDCVEIARGYTLEQASLILRVGGDT